MVDDVRKEIRSTGNPEKAVTLKRFFKTEVGQYGHGDIFLGLTVPQSRAIAMKYQSLPLLEVTKLLQSDIHEERLIALVILTMQYQKGTDDEKRPIYELYLQNTASINNWDLVDLSAEYIVGDYLFLTKHDNYEVLTKLARSSSLWERRIAILSTFAWIKKGESAPTFQIADILINDSEDLIHKAVGWLLREVGKRESGKDEEEFLKPRYKTMPRTMLRYAIERFPEEKRKAYLLGDVQ